MDRTTSALTLLAAVPLVLAGAAPAQAGGRPVVHDRYAVEFSVDEPDLCGLEARIDVTARGTFVVHPVKGSDEAYLGYDSYRVTELISTAAGWIRTERHGQFHEQRATYVGGDVWEFTFKDSGQFSVYDSSGRLLLRANGVLKAREQFDTLGDGEPGGVPVPGTFEVLHEAGPTVDGDQFCAAVQAELG